MNTIEEILDFTQENDIQFINLGFSDLLGIQKNITIMPSELCNAFSNGISFDAHAILGFKNVIDSDLLLFPDPDTLSLLPWRPSAGRTIHFFCDIYNPDGSMYEHDSRNILKKVIKRGENMGYSFKIGAESEFYLFKLDDAGYPTYETIDRGGYLDIEPRDKGEGIRREVCLQLDEMNIHPESSHHEQGPGQNEIDFRFSDPLTCADNLTTFKSIVKNTAARHGYYASFMPKPLHNEPGSGMHVNLSLHQNGNNIFKINPQQKMEVTNNFMAGILTKIQEITLFLNPTINSYQRFGEFEAPKYVTWSHQNRSQLIRIPASTKEYARMELRSPDCTFNPYLGFALIISAGLDGIEEQLEIPPSVDLDLYQVDPQIASSLTTLPKDLSQAITTAKDSLFIQSVIHKELLEKFIALKQEEITQYQKSANKQDFITKKYFEIL